LDGEIWNLKVGLKSTHSLDSSQIGSDDFILKLKDICWDIPTVAPTVDAAEYVVYLWDAADISTGNYISTDPTLATEMLLGSTWDADHDYCGGFTYTLEVVEVLAEAPISTMINPNTGVTITKAEIEEILNTIYTMD
jgi:hypothetical protein